MKNKQSFRKDNKGLSLIEIIIVLAIMSIIGGAFLLTTSIATDKQVSSCAEKLVSSLEQTRNLAMGKQSGFIEVWKTAGGSVYCRMTIDGQYYGSDASGIAIGHSALSVEVTEAGSPANVYDLNGHTARIEFSRSNGSVSSTPAVTQIKITNGRRTVIVYIDKFTGRVYSEKV